MSKTNSIRADVKARIQAIVLSFLGGFLFCWSLAQREVLFTTGGYTTAGYILLWVVLILSAWLVMVLNQSLLTATVPAKKNGLARLREWAELTNAELNAGMPKLGYYVEVEHQDGSVLNFSHASLADVLLDDEKWIVCFTEHHGFFVWHSQDLLTYCQAYRQQDLLDNPQPIVRFVEIFGRIGRFVPRQVS